MSQDSVDPLQQEDDIEESSQVQTATTSYAGHGRTTSQDSVDPLQWNDEMYQEETAGLAEKLVQVQIQEDEDEQPIYVDVYLRHKKQICFRNPEGKEVKTDESQWQSWTIPYDGELVPCFLYSGRKSKRQFYTWDIGFGEQEEKERKRKSKEKGKKHKT